MSIEITHQGFQDNGRIPEVYFAMNNIEKASFGRLAGGEETHLYTLTNKNGMKLVTSDYGCRIVQLWVPDRAGKPGDVVLGHRTLEEYLGANYQGTFVGRYANRIGGAKFSLGGQTYELTQNDGENTLHGGPLGFHQKLYQAQPEEGEEPSITYTMTSPDMEEGYPGNLTVQVKYTLTNDNELVIDYRAETDKETVFNPTNHAFFNLTGDPQQEVLDTVLQIHADRVTRVGGDLIPDGTFQDVEDTPLDFTAPKTIGRDIEGNDFIVQRVGGFDHNFCVDGEGLRPFAKAVEPVSGRVMEVFSDLPGVQLYTFNSVDGLIGKDGQPMKPHTAFCLETQYYPDSPNHDNFPFDTLKPGEPFTSRTVYRFSVE